MSRLALMRGPIGALARRAVRAYLPVARNGERP